MICETSEKSDFMGSLSLNLLVVLKFFTGEVLLKLRLGES